MDLKVEEEREAEEQQQKALRATNLELLLDLAFVYAVSQVSHILEGEETWLGIGHGTLLAWLLWWLWVQVRISNNSYFHFLV